MKLCDAKFLHLLTLPTILLISCHLETRKPVWWQESYYGHPGEYKGESPICSNKVDAKKFAIYDAIKKFYIEEIGIMIRSEELLIKSETPTGLSVSYRSQARAKYPDIPVKISIVKTHYEPHPDGIKCYVLIRISPEGIQAAKSAYKTYINLLKQEVSDRMSRAKQLEAEKNYRDAYLEYKTIEILLKDVYEWDPELKVKKQLVDAALLRLSKYQDPLLMVESLEPTATYLTDVTFVDIDGNEITAESGTYFVELNKIYRLKIATSEPVYVTVLNYCKGTNTMYLLYPNIYEPKPKPITNVKLIPSDTIGFVTVPPAGMNILILFACKEQNLIDFTKLEKRYYKSGEIGLMLPVDYLAEVLKKISQLKHYDRMSINFFIKEGS